MTCCDRYGAAEEQFGEKVAQRDLRSYQRRGPNPITRFLVAELRRWPLRGKQLLDIGGGIGIICAELAATGIAATLVEASPAYLEVARREVGPRYASGARFVAGDFVKLAHILPVADVVTLDRVVCCYPDARALLSASASRAGELLALSYPRDRWPVRAVMALENLWRKLKGSRFRTFVHSPQRMRAILEAAGLVHAARHTTFVWQGDLYRRRDAV